MHLDSKTNSSRSSFRLHSSISRLHPFLHVWKVFHAKTIRNIRFARCRKKYGNEDLHIEMMKATLRNRVQSTNSIRSFQCTRIVSCLPVSWSHILHTWKQAFPSHATHKTRSKLNLPLQLPSITSSCLYVYMYSGITTIFKQAAKLFRVSAIFRIRSK